MAYIAVGITCPIHTYGGGCIHGFIWHTLKDEDLKDNGKLSSECIFCRGDQDIVVNGGGKLAYTIGLDKGAVGMI